MQLQESSQSRFRSLHPFILFLGPNPPPPPPHTYTLDFTLLYDLRKVLVAAAQGHDMIINCILLDPKGDMIVTAVHILKLERYREK